MSSSFASPHFEPNAGAAVKTINGGPSLLYSLEIQNPNDTNVYLQLYDHANPTVGTTTPVQSYLIPAKGTSDKTPPVPLEFTAAIKYAVTTTVSGSGAPAQGVVVNATYGG